MNNELREKIMQLGFSAVVGGERVYVKLGDSKITDDIMALFQTELERATREAYKKGYVDGGLAELANRRSEKSCCINHLVNHGHNWFCPTQK